MQNTLRLLIDACVKTASQVEAEYYDRHHIVVAKGFMALANNLTIELDRLNEQSEHRS